MNKIPVKLIVFFIIIAVVVFSLQPARATSISIPGDTSEEVAINREILESDDEYEIVTYLNDPASSVRMTACMRLDQIGTSYSLSFLLERATDEEEDYHVRDEASFALWRIRYREAISGGGNEEGVLLEILNSDGNITKTPRVMGWAMRLLGDMGSAAALPLLQMIAHSYIPIASCGQLQDIQYNDLDGTYRLVADIDCVGFVFEPIGDFTGTFDGGGFTISNLTIDKPGKSNVGLFGSIGPGGVVSNVVLENVNITGNSGVAALAGENYGTIRECYATGSVETTYYEAGGLVGFNHGLVKDSYARVDISGDYYLGGLVAWNYGTITNTYATGTLTAYGYAGGLVGNNDGGTIENSFAAASIIGREGPPSDSGGLVGYNTGYISNCYWNEGEAYFYDASNSPMSGWDFTDVWCESVGTYPILETIISDTEITSFLRYLQEIAEISLIKINFITSYSTPEEAIEPGLLHDEIIIRQWALDALVKQNPSNLIERLNALYSEAEQNNDTEFAFYIAETTQSVIEKIMTPPIEIEYPHDGAILKAPYIQILGYANEEPFNELLELMPGENTYTKTVIDDTGNEISKSITIYYKNEPPILTPIGDKEILAGEILSFAISASDQDDTDLVYFDYDLPEGATFDYETQIFSWTPQTGDIGTYTVRFKADDGWGLTDEETITITVLVLDGNQSPILHPIGNKQGQEGEWFVIQRLVAKDPDGDSLTIQATNLPSGVRFFPTDVRPGYAEYKLKWPDRFVKPGTYTPTFTVTDGNGGTDDETITIDIAGGNQPPEFSPSPIPEQYGTEGVEFRSELITLTDSDGPNMNFAPQNLPTGAYISMMRISPPNLLEFRITWPAEHVVEGDYTVTFVVNDGIAPQVSESMTIHIAGTGNHDPVLRPIGDREGTEGQWFVIRKIIGVDDDGDILTMEAANLPSGARFVLVEVRPGYIEYKLKWPDRFVKQGLYENVTFTVRDGVGEEDSEVITIDISGNALEVNDQDDPDTGGDGLPDDWEMTHFGNLDQSAGDDFDGDGLTNLEEYELGADPLDEDTDDDGIPDYQDVHNLLKNPDFEEGLTDWTPFTQQGSPGIKEVVLEDVNGTNALHIVNDTDGSEIGVVQYLNFSPAEAMPIYVSYDVKAASMDPGAAVLLDLYVEYDDGTYSWITDPFRVKPDELGKWVKKEFVLCYEKPIQKAAILLLNYYHPSEAYYDNIELKILEEPTDIQINNGMTLLTINSFGYVKSLDYNGENQLSEQTALSIAYFKNGRSGYIKSFQSLGEGLYELQYLNSDIEVTLRITPQNGYFAFTIEKLINPHEEEIDKIKLFNFAAKHAAQFESDKDWAMNAADDELFIQALPLNVETNASIFEREYYAEAGSIMGIVGASAGLIVVPKSAYLDTMERFIQENGLPYVERDGEWFRKKGFYGNSYFFAGIKHANHLTILDYIKRGKFRYFLIADPFEWDGLYNDPRGDDFLDFGQMREDIQQFTAQGIKIGLHTFLNSLSAYDSNCTVDKLHKVKIGVLADNMSSVATNFSLNNYDDAEISHYAYYNGSAFPLKLVIDDEAIFTEYAEGGVFTVSQRGRMNSMTQSHSAGADVYIIPATGATVYIALDSAMTENSTASFANTAQALGIDFIYADGHRLVRPYGLTGGIRGNYATKYGLMPYLNRICEDTGKMPTYQFGDADGSSFINYFCDRVATWDAVPFENKYFTKNYKAYNMSKESPYANVRSEMGWWKINGAAFGGGCFDHDATTFDDIHYAMVKIIAFERSMGLQLDDYADDSNGTNSDKHALLGELFDLFGEYHTLIEEDIESGAIPKTIKAYYQDLDKEAELINGKLVEKKIDRKYVSIGRNENYEIENPFQNQRLKLEMRPRIDYYPFDDARHTLITDFTNSSDFSVLTSGSHITCDVSSGSGSIIVTNTSDTKDGYCAIEIPLEEILDMEFKRGIGLSFIALEGTGESIVVRLTRKNANRRRYFDVHIDSTGDKTVLLGKANPRYELHWSQRAFDYSKVEGVEVRVYVPQGSQAYSLQFRSIKALQEKGASPLINPSINVNGQEITFPVTLRVDDVNPHILEYDGGTKEYKLYTSNHKYISGGTITDDNIVLTNGLNDIAVNSDTSSGEYSTRADIRISVYDNSPPILNAIEDKEVNENELVTFTVMATDPDGDSLTFPQPENLPSGVTFTDNDNNTATFSWQTGYDDEGTYDITIVASDGNGGTDSKIAKIIVININRPPILRPIGDRQGQEGQWFAIRGIIATDPDGDSLTIEAENLPPGARFFNEGVSGGYTEYKLKWPGKFVKQGIYENITFTARDGNSGTDQETITITIEDGGNQTPVLSPIGDREEQEGQWFVIKKIIATDDDNDSLTLEIANRPSGAKFILVESRPGYVEYKLKWPDKFVKQGRYENITFTVTDGNGGTDKEVITITINPL